MIKNIYIKKLYRCLLFTLHKWCLENEIVLTASPLGDTSSRDLMTDLVQVVSGGASFEKSERNGGGGVILT